MAGSTSLRVKIILRVVATLIGAVIAFYAARLASTSALNRWYVPQLIKESPHDGQVGLGLFMTALYGGCASAVIVLAFGVLWIARTIRHPGIREPNRIREQ